MLCDSNIHWQVFWLLLLYCYVRSLVMQYITHYAFNIHSEAHTGTHTEAHTAIEHGHLSTSISLLSTLLLLLYFNHLTLLLNFQCARYYFTIALAVQHLSSCTCFWTVHTTQNDCSHVPNNKKSPTRRVFNISGCGSRTRYESPGSSDMSNVNVCPSTSMTLSLANTPTRSLGPFKIKNDM